MNTYEYLQQNRILITDIATAIKSNLLHVNNMAIIHVIFIISVF